MIYGSKAVVTAPPYANEPFDPAELRRLAHWASAQVKGLEADAIVAVGHSGLVIAGAVSLLTQVPVFAVRKNGEERLTHGSNWTSGIAHDGPVKRWVFLDDFVASGSTLRWAAGRVWHDGLVRSPVPEALVLYRSGASKRDRTVDDRWVEMDPSYKWGLYLNTAIPLFTPNGDDD